MYHCEESPGNPPEGPPNIACAEGPPPLPPKAPPRYAHAAILNPHNYNNELFWHKIYRFGLQKTVEKVGKVVFKNRDSLHKCYNDYNSDIFFPAVSDFIAILKKQTSTTSFSTTNIIIFVINSSRISPDVALIPYIPLEDFEVGTGGGPFPPGDDSGGDVPPRDDDTGGVYPSFGNIFPLIPLPDDKSSSCKCDKKVLIFSTIAAVSTIAMIVGIIWYRKGKSKK